MSNHNTIPSPTTLSPEQQQLQDLGAERDEKRAVFAQLSHERQSRMGDASLWNRDFITEYMAAHDDYMDTEVRYGMTLLQDQLDAAADEETADDLMAQYWINQQNVLRAETSGVTQSQTGWKFLNKMGKWLNSGTTKQKVVRNLVLGSVAGVVGGALGAAAGVAAVGAVTLATFRAVRGYATHQRGGMQQIQLSADELREHTGDIQETDRHARFAAIGARTMDLFESDTKSEQIQNRKAVAWGIGAAAVGGVIGAAAHYGLGLFEAPMAHATEFTPQTLTGTGADSYVPLGADTMPALGAEQTITPLGVENYTPLGAGVTDNLTPLGAVTDHYVPLGTDAYAPLGADHYAPFGTGGASTDYVPLGADHYTPLGVDNYEPLGTDNYPPLGADSATYTPLGVEAAPAATPEVGSHIYSYCYGTATEHLTNNVAKDLVGHNLTPGQQYLLTNELYSKFGANGVFRDVTLAQHGTAAHPNIWIMNPGGKTPGFTPEAANFVKTWLATHK